MHLIMMLALAAPLPFPKQGPEFTPGNYNLTWGGKEYALRLVNHRHYILFNRAKGLYDGHSGDWEVDRKGRLLLWWGKLDTLGCPPGRRFGYSSAEMIYLRYLPSDRTWAGKGWSDERQEWLKYELTREK